MVRVRVRSRARFGLRDRVRVVSWLFQIKCCNYHVVGQNIGVLSSEECG